MKKAVGLIVILFVACIVLAHITSSNRAEDRGIGTALGVKAIAPIDATVQKAQRLRFADVAERKYLSQGRDVHLTVAGKNSDVLVFRYVLAGRPDAYQISEDDSLLKILKGMGFTRIHLTDGYNHSWNIPVS